MKDYMKRLHLGSQTIPILAEIKNFTIAGNLILLCLRLCYYLDFGSDLCIHLIFIIAYCVDVEMTILMSLRHPSHG
jgi:hypothetical protein